MNSKGTAVTTREIKRILVATDGGETSQHAVALGVELAAAEGAEVTFVNVVPPVHHVAGRLSRPPVPRLIRTAGDGSLDDAARTAESRGVRFHRELIAGDVGDSIVAFADAIDADLIVVGERTRRSRLKVTVARWVARNSTRAVLVARPPVTERVAA
jgi:nucleotide-binding universal stress UspA family protein